jgi:murein DD-endopeptidase MepM/ murein hydrolase activator NlpD
MAESRWTVLFVPHGATGTRTLTVSGTVLKLVGGVVLVVAASVLVAAIGVVAHSVDLWRSWQLDRTNRALASEVAGLARRVHVLSDRFAVASRRDDQLRIVAGLDPLSPDVKRAGIGGPVGPWPERDQLLAEAGVVGREAFGVHTDLDGLIRRANIIAASATEAVDSVAAHIRELAATPTIMPTSGFITSGFAAIRYHPILHEDLPHEGIDIAAAFGTRILAPAAGRVIEVGREGGYGLMVVLDHGYGLQTRYAHMSRTESRVGELVKRGDLIGFVGSSGLSTGPHLHYEVRVNGRAVDPMTYILPDDFTD